MSKIGAAVVLLLRFLRAVALSGWDTVKVILRARRTDAAQPGFIRVRFAPMSERGAALLGCMVSLTPGTTTLDIDMARRELLVHVLDRADPDAVVAGIRREFEPALMVLCGRRGT